MKRVLIVSLAVTAAVLGILLLLRGSDPAPATTRNAGDAAQADGSVPAAGRVTARESAADDEPDERVAAPAPGVDARQPPAVADGHRVQVVDPDGNPIDGALVATFGEDPAFEVATDVDGFCTVPARSGRDHLPLRVTSDTRHRQANWILGRELRIVLPWCGPVRGRLVDAATGAPVAGAEVRRVHNYCKRCPPDSTRTADDGAFAFEGVPRDQSCTFGFTAEGFAPQHEVLRLPGRGEPVEHVFALRRGAAVAGRVVDLDTKRPLANVTVAHGGTVLATTDAGGAFAALVLPDDEGVAHLELRLAGYCRTVCSVAAPQPDAAVEYPLLASTTVRGRVRDPSGRGIAGARVRPQLVGGGAMAGMPEGARVDDEDHDLMASTDANGDFALGGLVRGGDYRLRAGHPDYERSPGAEPLGVKVVPAVDAAPVEIVLAPKPAVAGKGTIVGTLRCNGELTGGWLRWRSAGRQASVYVASGGAFRAEDVAAGRVELIAMAERFRDATGEVAVELHLRREVELAPDQELRLDLEYTVEEAAITGRVRYPDGSPAGGHAVFGRSEGLRFHAAAAADGTWSMPVPAALALVTVGAGGEPAQRAVAPGAAGVDFVVPPIGELRYRFRGEDGRPADPRVMLRRDGAPYFGPAGMLEAPDPEGFRTERCAQGRYTMVAAQRGAVPVVVTFVLGERATVDELLPAGVAVTLRLAADQAPLPEGCRVEFVDESLAEFGSSLRAFLRIERAVDLAAGGRLTGIGPGRHRLVASQPDVELVPDTIVVGARDATFDLRWRRRER